jgi:hypothetical protein
MAEANTASAESNNTAAEPSLEDVYLESGIDESQTQSQVAAAPVQAAPAQPEIEIPEVLSDEYAGFMKNLAQEHATLKANQQAVMKSELERTQAAERVKLEEDIRSASDYVSKNALENLPFKDEKTKAGLAEFELRQYAKENPKFDKLFLNRDSSPKAKAAWEKALTVVSKVISGKYEAQVDNTLAQNRNALREGRNTVPSNEQNNNSGKDEWAGLSDAEYQRKWQELTNPYN